MAIPYDRHMESAPATNVHDFTLTQAAANKVDALLLEDGSADALRVAVTGGGCSGFQYALGLDNVSDMQEDDFLIEHKVDEGDEHGLVVKVIIDQMTLDMLKGGQLDYDDGLMGKGFQVENPNATSSCGCGQSFDSPEAPCR